MNEQTVTLIQSAIAFFGAPLITKIVAAIKDTEKVENKYLPFVSMGVGALVGVLCALLIISQAGFSWFTLLVGFFLGITSGAAGTGTYEAQKNLTTPQ